MTRTAVSDATLTAVSTLPVIDPESLTPAQRAGRRCAVPNCRRLLADYPTAHTPAAITSSPTQPTCFRCPKCSTPMLIVERFSVTPVWQLSPRSAYLDSS